MKIKLFYPDVIVDGIIVTPESENDFEDRVNKFLADNGIIDIKYQEVKTENGSVPHIMVMYK